jgi:hypothetical protein
MSYRIDYSHLPAGPQRDAAALKDAEDYMGTERFNKVLSLLVAEIKQRPSIGEPELAIALSFAGVQGPPAHAMITKAKGLAHYATAKV